MPTLRSLRRERGLSLEGLASAIELNPGTLSLIETGQRQPPHHVAAALARELEITLGDVIELALEAQAAHRRSIAEQELVRSGFAHAIAGGCSNPSTQKERK
jgi:transcriptional regulator with XRE-family HTH domain